VVLAVLLEVLSQMADAVGEEGDLPFGSARIFGAFAVLRKNFALLFSV